MHRPLVEIIPAKHPNREGLRFNVEYHFSAQRQTMLQATSPTGNRSMTLILTLTLTLILTLTLMLTLILTSPTGNR